MEEYEIEIYFNYDYLAADYLAEFMGRMDRFYRNILEYGEPSYYSSEHDIYLRNFLEIGNINTGESLKIQFKEGWLPNIKIGKKHQIIKVPMNLGIPAIALYFLLVGAQKLTEMHNTYLDNQIKKAELDLKKIELFEKIKNSTENFDENPFEKMAEDTLKILVDNSNISYLTINDIKIKDEK